MSRLTRFADWLLEKAVPTLLRPRWGARQAMGSFLNQGSVLGHWVNSWTDSRYEMVKHYKHWVYVAVDRIATEVAMHLPNVSYLQLPEEKALPAGKGLKPWQMRKALTPLLSHEQLSPAPHNHPLCRLLRDPNEPDTSYDLWYETTMFLLLTGNAYWWLPANEMTGKPAAIWVMPSHWMYAHADEDGYIDSYEVRPVEGNYVRMVIPAGDILHFRRKHPSSKIDGYSPQSACAQWIDTQESIDRTRWWSFKNGIFPGVSVEFDPNIKLPDENDLNRIEARLMGRYSGEHNANKPIMVPPGAKLRKMQLTAAELGHIESSEQMCDQILAIYRVPRATVGLAKDMTYGSIRAAVASLYTGAINPLYHFYGQHVTEKLAQPRYDRRLRTWWEDRTPNDPELREKSLMTDLAYGARTMNEVRQLRGEEPYPHAWADEPWIPMNTLPVSLAIEKARGEAQKALSAGGGSPGANRETVTDPANTPRFQINGYHGHD